VRKKRQRAGNGSLFFWKSAINEEMTDTFPL